MVYLNEEDCVRGDQSRHKVDVKIHESFQSRQSMDEELGASIDVSAKLSRGPSGENNFCFYLSAEDDRAMSPGEESFEASGRERGAGDQREAAAYVRDDAVLRVYAGRDPRRLHGGQSGDNVRRGAPAVRLHQLHRGALGNLLGEEVARQVHDIRLQANR